MRIVRMAARNSRSITVSDRNPFKSRVEISFLYLHTESSHHAPQRQTDPGQRSSAVMSPHLHRIAAEGHHRGHGLCSHMMKDTASSELS